MRSTPSLRSFSNVALHSGMHRAVYPQEFSKVDVGRAPRTGIEVA